MKHRSFSSISTKNGIDSVIVIDTSILSNASALKLQIRGALRAKMGFSQLTF